MKIKVIDINGVEKREIEVSDSVFNIEPNKNAIYESVKNELANKRQGTHSTKTKAEVAGSGTKPWKQKGTGRARVGTKRNPVWTHGGVAFGPKPRDYSYTIPKKVKQLAYRSVLSDKLIEKKMFVIEGFSFTTGKTKDLLGIVNNILKGEKSAFIVTDKDALLKRAGRNVSWLKCLSYSRLNVCDLFYATNLLITEESIMNLNSMLLKD
ncbi:MAG: 50S ribosomal protein L4 [Spirochaetes bacterium GWD1_27_9]|nr:MAG: 50S ribosomal protein L4 [Spirochaetes bacterium GWB1_27_13]OHD21021.1 MAG: 50S ribosomal protein L4 [Spirochaetes bacterium GWC1_27_15]OHD45382.1 MAG: 50S ribosomal protein L4 [Spirochaetes bacterium GWD1_27_9]